MYNQDETLCSENGFKGELHGDKNDENIYYRKHFNNGNRYSGNYVWWII